MIHPINIPDDLLAQNPQRPQFLEPRRRQKIIYNKDGRKLNLQGQALVPKSPNTNWNDFFLRSFVRHLAVNNDNFSEDDFLKGYSPALIDIVDFQLKTPNINNSPNFLKLIIPKKKLTTDSKIEKSLTPDQVDIALNEYINSDKESTLNTSTKLGLSERLPLSRQTSARLSVDILSPIIEPCCSPFINNNEYTQQKKNFKEFARFDFSHSNFFTKNNFQQLDNESNREKRKSLIHMVPNLVGSRIWTSDNDNQFCKAKERYELLFFIESVIARRQQFEILIKIFNALEKHLNLEISMHIHEAEDEKIGNIFKESFDTIYLPPQQEIFKTIKLKIDEDIERLFTHEKKYLLITLHGCLSKG